MTTPTTGYVLYHGSTIKADSQSLKWIRSEAMPFHRSAHFSDVFILPRLT